MKIENYPTHVNIYLDDINVRIDIDQLCVDDLRDYGESREDCIEWMISQDFERIEWEINRSLTDDEIDRIAENMRFVYEYK